MQYTRETILLIEKKKAGAVTIEASSCDSCPNAPCHERLENFLSDFLLFNTLIKMEPTYWSASDKSISRLNTLAPELVKIIDSLNIKNIIIPCQINSATIGILRIETTDKECEGVHKIPNDVCGDYNTEERKLQKKGLKTLFGLSYVPDNWTSCKISLTKREHEILSLFSLGESIKSTSDFLYLSRNTINTHTQSIYKKLCANNRQQAVYKAHAFGLIDHSIAM